MIKPVLTAIKSFTTQATHRLVDFRRSSSHKVEGNLLSTRNYRKRSGSEPSNKLWKNRQQIFVLELGKTDICFPFVRGPCSIDYLCVALAHCDVCSVAIHCLACANHKGEGLLHLFKAVDRHVRSGNNTESTSNS